MTDRASTRRPASGRVAAARPSRRRRRFTRPPDARPSDVSTAVYVGSSELHGLGMFAAERIPAGTLIGRLLGHPTHEDGTYVLWISDELGLELVDDLRYINHSRTPNCELTEVDVVTLRAIAVDEELTHDYGWR